MPPDFLFDVCDRLSGVYDTPVVWCGFGQLQIHASDALVEIQCGQINAVDRLGFCMSAGEPDFHWQVKQDSKVWFQTIRGVGLDGAELLKIESQPATLIGIRGIDISIADHPGFSSKGGCDDFPDMLGACSSQHEHFGLRENSIVAICETQQQRAKTVANAGTSWFASGDDVDSRANQFGRQALDLKGFSAAFRSFKDDESSWHAIEPHVGRFQRGGTDRDPGYENPGYSVRPFRAACDEWWVFADSAPWLVLPA